MRPALDARTHTRRLLYQGIFSHLSDQEISNIHHLILSDDEDANNHKRFIRVWRMGDYTSDFTRLQLLQETNIMLQRFGERMIEEDFLETLND
jgi:hypothetical protein